MEDLQCNINSLLREIDKIRFTKNQSHASLISESRLDSCIVNTEVVVEDDNLTELDHSQREAELMLYYKSDFL